MDPVGEREVFHEFSDHGGLECLKLTYRQTLPKQSSVLSIKKIVVVEVARTPTRDPRRSVGRRWISVGNRWTVRDEPSTGCVTGMVVGQLVQIQPWPLGEGNM